MARCKYQGQFGPSVIGQEAFDAEKEAKVGAKDIFGPAVTASHMQPVPDEPIPAPDPLAEEEETVELLSVRALKEEIKGDVAPSTIDRLMRAEFLRPEGARKSVLNLLKAKEAAREQPRQEVLEALDAKLAEE